jgi:hypothetical protein
MALNTSPPTTSGVVVLSGSNFFSPTSSDFPVIRNLLFKPTAEANPSPPVIGVLNQSAQTNTNNFGSTAVGGLIVVVPGYVQRGDPMFAKILRIGNDTRIRQTPVTTSGVVILDIFPDAGEEAEVFVPPVVINARIYPLYQGPIPSPATGRIFPLLPQFSTLTPGD